MFGNLIYAVDSYLANIQTMQSNPPEDVQLKLIRESPSLVLELINPSNTVQVFAVSRSPDLILRIKNPCPAAWLVAVKQKGWYLEYAPDYIQTEEIVLEAIKQNVNNKEYIKIPLTERIIAEIVLKEFK